MIDRDNLDNFKRRTAIVILAYADYESLELAMASHARFSTDAGIDIYILQNGRGSYDCERTYAVAKRYKYLYPDTIHVVDDIKPGSPFHSLRTLFNSKRFERYDHIIKLDDDVMVLTPDWADKLISCYMESRESCGDSLAYVTSLVNNNTFGFKQIIDSSKELSEEYFSKIARRHYVGHDAANDTYAPHRILPKEVISTGANGTIWRYPYIARWLHRETSLRPEQYIKLSEGLGRADVNNKERYSINCVLFEKKLWTEEIPKADPESADDEHLLHAYCLKYNKRIIAELSVPMIHLFFFSQRDECRDMIDEFRACYTGFFKLPFPIALCDNRLVELENRMRYLEEHGIPNRNGINSLRNIWKKGVRFIKELGIINVIKKAARKIRER